MNEPRVALVTGASRGIGRAIAVALARAGFDLLVTARSAEALSSLATELARETGRRVETLAADLREPAVADRLVAAALDRFGRVDLLVNDAGATKRGPFLELTEADWQDGYALKLFGAVRMSRAVWPALVASKGQIVNIIGAGGRTPSAAFTIGGSVNAALMNFTKALAEQGFADGVRVNGINPGWIRTGRLRTRIEQASKDASISHEEAATRLANANRIARFGEPEEIASVVVFLAAGGGTYIHGALLDVDGGITKGL